ncbi:uncharacterized protein C2845_PM13G17940 [Panicum miliaceum]|uniref:Transposase (putative) gypsy type domain-containing protein n=1 Tax=Panicum miliaceum TaxID=4540 RepID=A0A3L6RGJ2_PANMI|nr:uncharacterized protein C2845_PM13G17940 [Panicum miliaceum]
MGPRAIAHSTLSTPCGHLGDHAGPLGGRIPAFRGILVESEHRAPSPSVKTLSVDEDGVARARGLMSPKMILCAGSTFPEPRHIWEIITFLPFLVVGLVPPFSSFFIAALDAYAIHLAHLSPNSIMTLAIFVHACEMFIGVSPSVEPFHHFFMLCRSSSGSPDPGAAAQPRTVSDAIFGFSQSDAMDSSTSR